VPFPNPVASSFSAASETVPFQNKFQLTPQLDVALASWAPGLLFSLGYRDLTMPRLLSSGVPGSGLLQSKDYSETYLSEDEDRRAER
jgi:hypothetical protein